MMGSRIKNSILIAGLWIVAVLCISLMLFFGTLNSVGFTSYNKVARDEENIYVTENGKLHGLVWKLDQDGKVQGFFSTGSLKYLTGFKSKDVAYADGTPRALFERNRDDNGRDITEYAIVIFNDEMKPTFITAPFRFDQELILTGFTSMEDCFYLTAVPSNRKSIFVYRIYSQDMLQLEDTRLTDEDVENWEKSQIKVASVLEEGTETGRFVAEAEYDESELHIRYDNSYPEYFAIDTEAGNKFNRFRPGVHQYLEMSGLNITVAVIVAAIGVVVVVLAAFALTNRNRFVYVVLSSELMFLLILGAFFGYHVFSLEKARNDEYFKFVATEMLGTFDGYSFTNIGSPEIYVTRDYSVITERQNRMISKDMSYDHIPDTIAVLVTDDTGKMILSGDGNNLLNVSLTYGSDARDVAKECLAAGRNIKKEIILNGENLYLIATPLSKAGLSGYAGLVVARYDTLDNYFLSEYGLLLLIFAVVYLIISIIVVLVFIGQGKDLQALAAALGRLSKGEENIAKPYLRGKDTNFMWNSIYEIQKNILHINRAKFQTYEAYYRFAPKGVENILGKQSIMEVRLGDSINLNGTIAHVASGKQVSINHSNRAKLDRFMQILHGCRIDYDGVFISHNNTLSILKLLFLDDNKETASFGTDFLLKLREDTKDKFPDTTVILDYSPLSYGIVGTEESSSIYMVSDHSDLLQTYAGWFRNMKVSLIITDTVLAHERIDLEYRYIGFIVPDEEKPDSTIKLYEIFDAESVSVHTRRLATREHFGEALELFYKQDFYFARNMFTEILRESPDDEISKWYLFECERYLNEAAPENFVGALHM